MEGRIYIARVSQNLDPSAGPVDTDPHFWNDPPTWGICRADYRAVLDKNDYVFFVSSQNNPNFPSMIFAYMKIRKIITHEKAFKLYPQKRMRVGARINGNIIVDSKGHYHPGDLGAHEDRFDLFKQHYAVGFKSYSRMLSVDEIRAKAPDFVPILNRIFGTTATTPYGVLNQKGRSMDYQQVQDLLSWLNHGII